LYNQIKKDKYIFFYGGKDNKRIQEFGKKALALANDPVIKEKKISVEYVVLHRKRQQRRR
jgi:hypothetical protein